MNVTRLHTILALITMTAVCHAEEPASVKNAVDGSGIRVAIRNAPGVDEFMQDYGGAANPSATYDEKGGVQLDVMYVKRFMGEDGKKKHGPVIGGGLFLVNSKGENPFDVGEAELTAFGLIGEAGYAVQLGNRIVLEALPFIGFGGASQDLTDFSTSGTGTYLQYGVKGSVYYLLGSNFEIGLEAGYMGFESTQDAVSSGTEFDSKLSGGGFQGGLVGVYKF